ncbi:MAG: DUF2207 domain-containing protein [Roseiflexus sp.]|nr:DUF2207 domain-containing protein [Roseiflexus sp.]
MDPALIVLLPMLICAVICGVLGWRNRWTHDPPPIGVIGRVMEPPDDLPPALAAWLIQPPGVTPQHLVIATIFDLARRGYLRVERRPSRTDQRRQRLTPVLIREPDDTIAPFERLILDTLLEDAPQVDINRSVAEPLWEKQRIQRLCDAALTEQELLDPAGPRRRRAYVVNAVAVVLLGVVASVATVVVAGAVPWWGWILLLLGNFVCWGLGGMFNDVRGVTQRGADARAAWSAFATYLKQLTSETAPEDRFARWLPYAVALDALKPFIDAYRSREPALPAWYRPNPSVSAAEGKTIALAQLQPASPGAEEMHGVIRDFDQALKMPDSST